MRHLLGLLHVNVIHVHVCMCQVKRVPHINLIESSEHGIDILSLFQPLSNPLTHARHLNLGRYV